RAATATRSSTGPSRQPVPSRPAPSRSSSVTVREEDEFDWYVTLDVPPDASRREILEAVRRRLEVARSIGDTTAPARIARAAAQSMKLRSGTAGTFGRRQ